MDDMNFIERYRSQVERGNFPAPDDVWQNISNQLDIDEVWTNIEAELNSEKKKSVLWPRLMWAAAVAAVLFVASYAVLVGIDGGAVRQVADVEVVDGHAKTALNSNVLMDNQQVKTDAATSKLTFPSCARSGSKMYGQEMLEYMIAVGSEGKADSMPIVNEKDEPIMLAKIRPKSTSGVVLGAKSASKDYIAAVVEGNNQPEFGHKNSKRGFAIGFTSSIKNTWLISGNGRTIDDASFSQSAKKSFPDFGVNIIYSFNSQLGVESNLFWASKTGKQYRGYVSGQYSDMDIELVYTKVEVAARYNFRPWHFRLCQFGLTGSFGGYFSSLTSAQESYLFRLADGNSTYYSNNEGVSTMDGVQAINSVSKTSTVTDSYKKADYGLTTGADLSIPFGKRVTLVPGLRLRLGLANVKGRTTGINSSTGIARNFSFDFRFSIYYDILGR